MNKFYKVINIFLALRNLLIAVGIILATVFNKVELMMRYFALGADSAIIQWCILFILFLLELILYLHKIITKKVFVFSIVAMFANFYLTYICMFTHTPDIFTAKDFIVTTKRFFFYMPLEYYWAILQGISYIVFVIVKERKRINGLQINIAISFFRIIILVLSLLPLLLNPEKITINVKQTLIILIVYFIISFIIETAIDFVFKKIRNKIA